MTGWLAILAKAMSGAIAACGFGILFNFALKDLVWCTALGALAISVRSLGLSHEWSLEAASFTAALTIACLTFALRRRLGFGARMIALASCIPMVPGAFLAQALLGFFTLTTAHPVNPEGTLVNAIEASLRVVFTLGAIGTGLTVPSAMARSGGPHFAAAAPSLRKKEISTPRTTGSWFS